ncbi:MAG TPA: hypothetical protein VKQ70_02720 [Caulobacteraceae bacterium]|jgi:hypothetical protein|nr:hypothetical protein [Caulobacteraceae bacterium]
MTSKLPALAALALAPLCWASAAAAHGIVGDRFFPATLITDDPAVADELSLPTIDGFKTADDPPNTQVDISGEWSKRLTSRFGVSFDGAWTDLKTPSGDVSGFQNFGTTFKYLAATNVPHELMVSVGLEVEWGKTGDPRVGADSTTTLTPTLYFGKGAGDLPASLAWARPFALTGVIGYSVPLEHDATRSLETGFALEYSLRYLASHVRDLGLPTVVNQLTPLIEVQLQTPLGVARTPAPGTINPGVLWSGQHMQLGLEAMVPINSASGHNVGAVFQVHWFLDDLFPKSLGKPIW